MARFLVTGGRSPVALELVKNLSSNGHSVYLVDSLKYVLASCKRFVEKYYYICDPRGNISDFKKELLYIVDSNDIDVIVPTCEEAIYISYIKSALSEYCTVFCPPFDLIKSLHSKRGILDLCQGLPISLPKTHYFIESDFIQNPFVDEFEYILKPEFGRFGNKVLYNPSLSQIRRFVKLEKQTCLLQEKIEGEEYCTYAISNEGRVLESVVYKPKYRLKGSAGYYFEREDQIDIKSFVAEFCRKYSITGQIGFDIIVRKGIPYLIECNPRATSGMHLLTSRNLSAAIMGTSDSSGLVLENSQNKFAMLVFGLPKSIFSWSYGSWRKDFIGTNDVLFEIGDWSLLGRAFCSLLELSVISLKKKISLRSAATQGIEWDGGDIR